MSSYCGILSWIFISMISMLYTGSIQYTVSDLNSETIFQVAGHCMLRVGASRAPNCQICSNVASHFGFIRVRD